MKYLLTAAALIMVSVNAQSYRGDISGGYISGSTTGSGGYQPPSGYEPPTTPGEPLPTEPVPTEPMNVSSSEDYEGWNLAGRIYFNEVETSRGPLALASFLQRTGHLGLTYTNTETDSGAETKEWVLDSRFVINSLVMEAAYGKRDGGASTQSDADLWRAALGYYIGDDTQVRAAYEATDTDGGDNGNRYVVDITHVQDLSNGMTWSANALVGWVDEDADDGTDLNLLFDWFFNDNVSVGTELTYSDRDVVGNTFDYEVHGDYFITDRLSLRLSYFNQDYGDTDVETDGLLFQFLFRR